MLFLLTLLSIPCKTKTQLTLGSTKFNEVQVYQPINLLTNRFLVLPNDHSLESPREEKLDEMPDYETSNGVTVLETHPDTLYSRGNSMWVTYSLVTRPFEFLYLASLRNVGASITQTSFNSTTIITPLETYD